MRWAIALLCVALAAAALMCSIERTVDYAGAVDPFIGTGGHGHTYPGASLPFGMVQASPDTRLAGWDGCSGYHYADSVVYGFSHTHLSGTGASDYGDILFMPTVGAPRFTRGDGVRPVSGYASRFSHANEEASPGYYRVKLENSGVIAELAAGQRVAMHRYTFPATDSANVIIDLQHRDEVIESYLRIPDDTHVEGYRRSRHWADDQRIYFSAEFSKPFAASGIAVNDTLLEGVREAHGTNCKAFVRFSTRANERIMVKVALSPTYVDNARKNALEIPHWDFDKVRSDAGRVWNEALGKIAVKGGTRDERTIFYTALYHAMLAPNLFMDRDGMYRGRDGAVHQAEGFTYYTVFSLWDTYRAAHPLFAIIEPARTVDFIKTFIRQYEEGGLLPVWELAGNETNCMIGYHAVPVIADSYVKGIRGFDAAEALSAMKHSAETDFRGLAYYRELGYIPSDREGESVSKTLEYAYDDWCIAQMAKALGNEEDYARYIERAQFYKNLFDPASGFMRAKANGAFVSPFDPAEVNFNYTEANAWQYSFAVPQDVNGLISLMGGADRFVAKLDSLFTVSSETGGIDLPDVSGLIGQYAHGNEPSHHMAYLYSYAGRPWKTQERVRRIMSTLYGASPDGLCGNEDCGQMSAWYVFGALGFYPVTPGSDVYVIASPIFREASIDVGGGKRFVIKARGASSKKTYIQSATLNGRPYTKAFITHGDLLAGGELVFTMGERPNERWGAGPEEAPRSAIADHLILPVPYVSSGLRLFTDATEVALASITEGALIRYELGGAAPGPASPLYAAPIHVARTTGLAAIAFKEGFPPSRLVRAEFRKIPGRRSVKLGARCSPMYSGGGELALVDGLRGGADFRTGAWQGYEGVDLDAVVDLGATQTVRRITAGFLRNQNSWIFLPERVEYSISTDGAAFTKVAEWAPGAPSAGDGDTIRNLASGAIDRSARFVRVYAKSIGVCPAWHPGAGGKAWVFVDEIVID